MERPMSRFRTLAVLALALTVPTAYAAGVFGSDPASTPSGIASKIGHKVPATLLKTLSAASQSGLSMTPAPGDTLDLQSINGPRVAKGNKVGLLYVGADFCPYCAGQRWALVLALLRFGQFHGLEYMASSPTDAYANTPTFTFQNATYTSKYVDFSAVETMTRHGKKLQSMNKAQSAIFNKFNAPPYKQQFGGIPFVYIGGLYMLTIPMVRPDMLGNMDWDQIAGSLNNQQSNLFQAVMPQVNALSAAICRMDGGNPDNVCSAPGVTAANAVLYRMASQQSN